MEIILNGIVIIMLIVCNEVGSAPTPPSTTEKTKLNQYFLHAPYGPETYAFGYELEDPNTGNIQFRDERRYLNGSIEGSFGYVRPDKLIEVANYRSDGTLGFQSQTRTYKAGDERVAAAWPTRRPDILVDSTTTTTTPKVRWDEKSHLNITDSAIHPDIADALLKYHGVNLNTIDLEKSLREVQDALNAEASMKKDLPVEEVHKFVPSDFPIIPFETPHHEQQQQQQSQEDKFSSPTTPSTKEVSPTISLTPLPATNQTTITTTDRPRSSSLRPPKPLVKANNDSAMDWYEKIIKAQRRAFLQNLPKLS